MGLTVLKNASVNGKIRDVNIDERGGRIESITAPDGGPKGDEVVECGGRVLLPAFTDMHTHLREPGYEYKEDISSGCMAAVAGGYANVCCMPNTKPAIDSTYIVKYILQRAKETDLARVYPIGAVSVGLEGETMSEMGKLKEAGIVAVSDDGQPVNSAQLMRLALEYAKDFGLLVISHCEDKSLVEGGVVNEGANATRAGLRGITRAAEEVMIARDIVLAQTFDARVHIAHVSTEGGVTLVREAKARGVKVSCETCPHYFAGTDDLIADYNTAAKVNPPLRTERDRQAIIEGLVDGTIDVIATDHAPHARQDKEVEFPLAANGISGLETAFALSYTHLVKSGRLSLDKLSRLMSDAPCALLGLECGALAKGALADLVLVDLDTPYRIDADKFFSKGKNTPFDGQRVFGKVLMTMVGGKIKKSALGGK